MSSKDSIECQGADDKTIRGETSFEEITVAYHLSE